MFKLPYLRFAGPAVLLASALVFGGCSSDELPPAPTPDAAAQPEPDTAVAPPKDTGPAPDGPATEAGAPKDGATATDVAVTGDGATADGATAADGVVASDVPAGEVAPTPDAPPASADSGPCGTAGSFACAGAMCGAGMCINDGNRCIAVGTMCGPMAGQCQASGSCMTGMTPCGGLDQACCGIGVPPEGAYCSKPGTTCTGAGDMRTCKACGAMGQPCCGEGAMGTCAQGTCMGMGATRTCM